MLRVARAKGVEVVFENKLNHGKRSFVGTAWDDGTINLLRRHRDRLVEIFLHELLHLVDWEATEKEVLCTEKWMMKRLTEVEKNKLLIALTNKVVLE